MKNNRCENLNDNARRCAAIIVTLGMAIGKAGFYGAATSNMPRVISRVMNQNDANASSNYKAPLVVFIAAAMFFRTGFVYGPEVYLQLAGRDRNEIVKFRYSKCLVETEVQFTSMATALSGYLGAAVLLNKMFSCRYLDPGVIALSSLVALCNYVGEYCLAGGAIRHALAKVEVDQVRRDSEYDYESLSTESRTLKKQCDSFTVALKSCALLFQSLDEAMAMVFLFYCLQKDIPDLPVYATITVGALSAVSTFIRTGILYAPRMKIVDDGLQTRKEDHLRVKCGASGAALVISLSCAAGKMFAAASGYSDGEMMLDNYINIGSMNEAGYVSLVSTVILFLLSSFVTEIYFNLVDSRVACSHIQKNSCCP
jgi:hypothetical protein